MGETLTGGRGTWTGTYLEFVDSWQRCDAAGANCLTIDGSFGEDGYTLTTTTSARRSASPSRRGTWPAGSTPSRPRSPCCRSRRRRTPRVRRSPERSSRGRSWSATPGSWTGAPTFAYQWQHCAADGTTCTDVDRATGSTYTLTTGDAGFRMRLVVTARNDAGSATAASDARRSRTPRRATRSSR